VSLCACGCGQEVKEGRKYILYHGGAKRLREAAAERTEREEEEINKIPLITSPDPISAKTVPPPTKRDREIELKLLELHQIDKFMGGRHQNTVITEEERTLLAVLYHDLASNPWENSRQDCEELGIAYDPGEFGIVVLQSFVLDYLDFGLPINRLGREEVQKIFTAYFSRTEEEEKRKQEKMIT
jgi:hypothetical protein